MSVMENIQNGDYENKLPYPKMPSKPLMPRTKSAADFRAYANALEEYEAAMVDAKEVRRLYNEETSRLQDQFRKDLEAEYDMTDHPKRDKLFSMAWSYGHSSGLSEVAIHYGEFVELV